MCEAYQNEDVAIACPAHIEAAMEYGAMFSEQGDEEDALDRACDRYEQSLFDYAELN